MMLPDRGWLYSLVSRLLFLFDAESVHHLTVCTARILSGVPGFLLLVKTLFASRDQHVAALGLSFPNRVGLAGGFDKNGECIELFEALGFGFIEVGTVTPKPQPGNPRPRIFRVREQGALINRLGFNNDGVDALVQRVERARARVRFPIGVNIGKNKSTPDESAIDDYRICASKVARVADYVVVNVSSPNTPGLRSLQSVESLGPILVAVRAALDAASPERRVPLCVKIAPDLANEDIDQIAALVVELSVDGVIATNTTIARAGMETQTESIGAGGLSGAPLTARAGMVLDRLVTALAGRAIVIAVGGIMTASEAKARVVRGASLVQVYTGLIYNGPGFARRIARATAVVAMLVLFIACAGSTRAGDAGRTPSGDASSDARWVDAGTADASSDTPTRPSCTTPRVRPARIAPGTASWSFGNVDCSGNVTCEVDEYGFSAVASDRARCATHPLRMRFGGVPALGVALIEGAATERDFECPSSGRAVVQIGDSRPRYATSGSVLVTSPPWVFAVNAAISGETLSVTVQCGN